MIAERNTILEHLEKNAPSGADPVLGMEGDVWYTIHQKCAGSARAVQSGETPDPVKLGKQPVLSLGAEAVRPGLSVGRGVREPQCESVK